MMIAGVVAIAVIAVSLSAPTGVQSLGLWKREQHKPIEGHEAGKLLMDAFFDGRQVRLLRCESSQWNHNSADPGSTDFVDWRGVSGALGQILAVVYYTTADRVVIGDFAGRDGEFYGAVSFLDSNLAKRNTYRSAFLKIGERDIQISLFTENGKYYSVKEIGDLNWDLQSIKNGLQSYLDASVWQPTYAELFIGDLEKKYYEDGSGSLDISFAYKSRR